MISEKAINHVKKDVASSVMGNHLKLSKTAIFDPSLTAVFDPPGMIKFLPLYDLGVNTSFRRWGDNLSR